MSATAVVLVNKDWLRLGVSDTVADILWDCLDTAMILSDAGKDDNKKWVSSLLNNLMDSAVVHLHYPYAANSHRVNDLLIDDEASWLK